MSEVIVATSSKDSGGIVVIDLTSGSSVSQSFKNCIADPGNLTFAGSGSSSYAGNGSPGDYIVASQSKKTVINIWHWSKPQVHMQCHTQEIMSAIATDGVSGVFVFGGSKRGWLYVWDITTGELIRSWQAHFKAINRIVMDPQGLFCFTCSDDGIVHAWDIAAILDSSSMDHKSSTTGKKSLTPFRSWNCHTLPVRDLLVMGCHSSLRIVSCSIDRTVVISDVHSGKQCLRISLPYSIESIACSNNEDFLFAGSAQGGIYIIDTSLSSIAVNAANAHVRHLNERYKTTSSSSDVDHAAVKHVVLEGHTKTVVSLSCSLDGVTLVSASEDGTLRFWHMWTKQCLREVKPFAGISVTNAKIIRKPELIGMTSFKPYLHPIEHLSKYPSDDGFKNKTSATSAAPTGTTSTVGAVSNTIGAAGSTNANLLGTHIMGSIRINSNKRFPPIDFSTVAKYGINSAGDNNSNTGIGSGSGIKKFKSPGSISKTGNIDYVQLDDGSALDNLVFSGARGAGSSSKKAKKGRYSDVLTASPLPAHE